MGLEGEERSFKGISVMAAPEKGFGWMKVTHGEIEVFFRWQNGFHLSEKSGVLKNLIINDLKDAGANIETLKSFKEKFAKEQGKGANNDWLDLGLEEIAWNKYHKEILGPKFNHRATAAFLSEYFYTQPAPVRRLVTRRHSRGLSVDFSLLSKVNKVRKIVKQTIADGLDNIVPVVVFHGVVADKLRQTYGKGRWKRIANQSFSANVRLVEFLSLIEAGKNGADLSQGVISVFDKFMPLAAWKQEIAINTTRSFGIYNDMNATLTALIVFDRAVESHSKREFFLNDDGLPTNNPSIKSRVFGSFQVIDDTLRLIRTLNESDGQHREFLVLKGQKKLDELHRNLIAENNARRLSQLSFNTFDRYPTNPPKSIEYEGYTFRLLINEYDLFTEGNEMHHCIHSYIDRCMNGVAICYSISGPERASVAFAVKPKNTNYVIMDLKSKYNGGVSPLLVDICQRFGRELVNQMKDPKKQVLEVS